MDAKLRIGRVAWALLMAGALGAGAAWAAQPQGAADGTARTDRPILRAFLGNIRRLAELKETLNLTPEQKAGIGAILKSHKPEIAAALAALRDKHDKLLQAIRAEVTDEAAIRAAGREMGNAIADASVLRARVRREICALLTPDQRRQVDQALEQVRSSINSAIDEFAAQ